MKKRIALVIACVAFCCLSFSLEPEGIATWRKMVRTFAGATHVYAKVYIRLHLQENKAEWIDTRYGIELWVRELRDYRLDILEPDVLSGITVLFRYRENYFSVLDRQTRKRANQRVSLQNPSELETNFNPQTLVSNFADFLLGLIENYNPLLELSYKKEEENHYYTLLIKEPTIFAIFKKEYPEIIIHIDENDHLRKIVLRNEKTLEALEIDFVELVLSAQPSASIQEAFNIRESEYQLIEYIDLK
jgi:hypothetical protein